MIRMKPIARKAQHLGEVALLFAIVLAAIVGIQTYVKRGLQARYKSVIDAGVNLTQQAIPDTELALESYEVTDTDLMQYEPYYTDEESNHAIYQVFGENKDGKKTGMGQYFKSETNSTSISDFNYTSDGIW